MIKTIVINATAQSADCYPLTACKPNALMSVFNKTLLEHCLDQLINDDVSIKIVVDAAFSDQFYALELPDYCTIEIDHSYLGSDRFEVIDASIFRNDTSLFEINHAWDLLACSERFAKTIIKGDHSEATIEDGVTLKGNISVGKGTILKRGTYIEGDVVIGENCMIGPNCFIRGVSSIGDNARIGNAVELKNVIIGKNVNVCHLSYLGDSIVDDDTNLGAGFICSNLRHDGEIIETKLQGKKISTGRNKLGAIIGQGVHTGVRTTVYPARKIYPFCSTLPSAIVKEDIE
ncbi:MAG: hypothetical protein RR277_02740 [Rikenellaceae bacterium]